MVCYAGDASVMGNAWPEIFLLCLVWLDIFVMCLVWLDIFVMCRVVRYFCYVL